MTQGLQCPASHVLDAWIAHEWRQGVQLSALTDFAEIVVETRNSVYEITTIDGGSREILVRGGTFFPDRTPARLSGSSLGGSFLKIGGIYVGFNMEFVSEGRTIVTSTVQSIRIILPARS
jgi:hypothetical protein